MSLKVDVVVEVSRGSLIKRRADGSIDFVSPVPCPFNYGSVVGQTGGDGDPLDAILLGKRVARGRRVSTTVQARVVFVDAGAVDDKLVCGTDPMTSLQRLFVIAFFRIYAIAKRVLHRVRGIRGPTTFHGIMGPRDE